MPLSWNEIKLRATAFSKEWENETSEDAEAKSFWDGFFNVFGISRRRVATFEHAVKSPLPVGEGPGVRPGFIDLLWKGVILIEHKSRGKDLNRAYQQAKDYFPGLKDKELPRYILVSDFEKFRLHDLDENTSSEFTLSELVNNISLFGFIAGYQKRTYKEQDPVNIEAAELMGRLHDKLKAIGYEGHHLEVYLVRLLFCLFADDTSIFERGIFYDYIDLKTNEDGSDLARAIAELFQVLNTPAGNRFKNLDESLAAFPYVNGKLFEEYLPLASFDSEMRRTLLDCCLLDWGKISPAIFGSLFQSVMDEKARRNLGAHYTSEKNILKLIKPLFLDELWKDFEQVKESKAKLQKFHDKISKLRFLDPACGCGNFLIIAYRELRMLEIEVIKTLLFRHEKLRAEVAADAGIDIGVLIKCDVDRFYGIEYEEFAAQIAQVAMWLIDHQMNQLVSNTFGEYYVRLPLRKSATIKHGNALRTDWQTLIEPLPWEKETPRFHFILGNPPFVGKTWQNAEQRKDIEAIFSGVNSAGLLDYVTCWYIKAAQYMKDRSNFLEPDIGNTIELPLRRTLVQQDEYGLPYTQTAFVSTNSISQGEQVGILWNELINNYKIKINFAHRTFSWSNEARGNAGVHVVIIGFATFDRNEKSIFEYTDLNGEPHEVKVSKINPYLVEGNIVLLKRRIEPICNVPKIGKGNQPTDGGFLLMTKQEKDELENREPLAIPYIKKFLGGQEFIQGIERFCLWLVDINPSVLRKMPKVLERLDSVRKMREISTDPKTREMAKTPWLFRETDNFDSFVAIPEVSSERRTYIPIGFLDKETIPSNKLQILPNGTIWHFGILTSSMHMAWTKYTCGRLESRYQYSAGIVYNNFPWPENSTDKQKEAVEKAAQAVLDARAQFPGSSLADLYDPNTMPPVLLKAHQALDKAVDMCYRSQPFPNETKRIEFLFELYDKYTAGLFVKEKKKKIQTPKQ